MISGAVSYSTFVQFLITDAVITAVNTHVNFLVFLIPFSISAQKQ